MPKPIINAELPTKKKGDETQAIADFTQAIANDSRKGNTYSSRGMIYKKQKNFDLAIKDFSNAVTWNPNDANSFYHRGEIYFDQGKLELAEISFNLAITIDKSYQRLVDTHKFIAKTNASLNQGKQTETNLPKPANVQPTPSPKYNPTTPPLTSIEKEKVATEHLNNAIFNFRGDKFENAVADFTKYLQVYSNSAEGYYNRGLTYAKWGKSASAIADFEQALKLKPDFPKAKTELDKLKQIKTDEIVTSISRITDVKPTDEFYEDLQSLIERYGISKVTKNKKYSPNKHLTMNEYADFIKQGKEYLRNSASGFGIKAIDEEKLFNSKCTLPYLEMIPEKEIAKSLSCNYRIKNFSMPGGENWVTRGKFAIYFNKAIQQASLENSINSQAESVSNDLFNVETKQPAKTVSAKPNSGDVSDWTKFLKTGTEKLKVKDYDGAIQSLTQCLNLVRNVFCLQSRATAYGFKKNYNSALKDLDEVLEKNKEEPELFSLRAKLRIKAINGKDGVADLNNFLGATLDLDAAIKLDPKNPQWHLERSQVHCLKKEEKFLAKIEEEKVRELGGKVIEPCK